MMRRVRIALVVAALAATGIGVAAGPAQATAHASCAARGYTAPIVTKWALIKRVDPDQVFKRGHLSIYWSDSRHRVCAEAVSAGTGADSMNVKIKRVGDADWNDTDPGNYSNFAGGVVSRDGLGSGDCVRIYGEARYSTGTNPGFYSTDVKVHWNHPDDMC